MFSHHEKSQQAKARGGYRHGSKSIIAETPSGLSGFLLSPKSVPSEIRRAILNSNINAMDSLINPSHNVHAACRDRILIKSWQMLWGEAPSPDFENKLRVFCDKLQLDYGLITEASSQNLIAMMNKSYRESLATLQSLKSECDTMMLTGTISKARASLIRNQVVEETLTSFRYVYDPFKPYGAGLVMNNKLQASLIGEKNLYNAISDLNISADHARAACANVLINW